MIRTAKEWWLTDAEQATSADKTTFTAMELWLAMQIADLDNSYHTLIINHREANLTSAHQLKVLNSHLCELEQRQQKSNLTFGGFAEYCGCKPLSQTTGSRPYEPMSLIRRRKHCCVKTPNSSLRPLRG